MTLVELVPVEELKAGDLVALAGPGDRLREVANVEIYDDEFVVVYRVGGLGRAWENRATLKGVATGFAQELASLAPCRRGELVRAARNTNPQPKEQTMAIATAPARNGTEPDTAAPAAAQSIEMLPLALISPAPDNPRKNIGDLTELAASMSELGILQPLVVTPRGAGYLVVCGHRRYAAAGVAKLELLPTIVRELTEPQRIKAMLIENCQREDLAPLEEARAYQSLVELGMSQRQIAADVGKTQSHISKRVALLELPAKAQAEIDSGGITMDDARDLLKLKEMPKRLEAALREGKRYRGGIARAVAGELRDHETAERVGKAVQQLKAKGVKVLAIKDSYNDRWPKGTARVKKGGQGYWGEVDLDPAKHAKEPCHAAGVDPRNGEIIYLCTKPANHKKGGKSETSADEKAAKAKERQRDQAKALRAREKNIALGATLEKKLRAPKIDARNMRLLAELLLRGEFGNHLALKGLRYVDEASQTVVKRKDETVSRIQHANDVTAARKILDARLAEAKTPEEIMGVVLQAFVAAKLADTNAVPPSQRLGYLPVLERYGTKESITDAIAKIAAPFRSKQPAPFRSKQPAAGVDELEAA